MIEQTRCAGVMIGRGALVTPWLFRDTHSYLTTGVIPPPPTLIEKCDLMRRHFANLIRFRGERVALIEFRKRVSWYAKTMHPCRMLRERMRLVQSATEFEQIISDFLKWRSRYDEDVASGRVQPLAEAMPEEALA